MCQDLQVRERRKIERGKEREVHRFVSWKAHKCGTRHCWKVEPSPSTTAELQFHTQQNVVESQGKKEKGKRNSTHSGNAFYKVLRTIAVG